MLSLTWHFHHLHTRGLALWKWKQLNTARIGNAGASLSTIICLKGTMLLFIACIALPTTEMNCCFLNLFKYIQTTYNRGTWLTGSYDNDFPMVIFIAITESWYFTAEPIFTALLTQALIHEGGTVERTKTYCSWVLQNKLCKHKVLRTGLAEMPDDL